MSLLLLFQGARIVRSYTDDAGSSDTLRRTLRRTITDDAGSSDQPGPRTLRRMLLDDTGSSDTISRALRRRFTDDAGSSDSFTHTKEMFRAFTDDTGSTDAGLLNGGALFPPEFSLWAGADLGNDTITVVNAPLLAAGRYSDRARDWADSVTTLVVRCSMQPLSAEESTADREFAKTHMRLFAPYDAPITAVSRIIYAGTTYEVDGEPGRWRDLDGRPSHVEAVLKRLTG